MIFSVTYDFADQLSGIEHAQLKRHAALQRYGDEKSTLVTLAYNRFLNGSMNKHNLGEDEYSNLFDFFQRSRNYDSELHRETVSDIYNRFSVEEKDAESADTIWINESVLIEIHLMSNPVFDGQINFIEYFDYMHNKISVDYYDVRGFKSMTDILGANGGVARQINYDIDGTEVIETRYKYVGDTIRSTDWIVRYQNDVHYFDDKTSFYGYYLDELNKMYDNGNIFISDRAYLTDAGLASMVTPRNLYIYWHSTFVPNGQDPLTTKPFDTLLDELSHYQVIDGLIVATKAEKEDLETIIKQKNISLPVYKVNSGIAKPREFQKILNNQIITVARIAPEKRLDLGVLAMELVVKEIPTANWHIYGYEQADIKQELEKMISDKKLDTNIHFHPYQTNLDEAYKNANVFWMTSLYEGFNMSQLEAMSYGNPSIAFDISYGPQELIINHVNGYIVENGNVQALAMKTIDLFSDVKEYDKMVINAAESTTDYTPQIMYQEWIDIFNRRKELN